MYIFWENVFEPIFKSESVRRIVEVGAQNGYNTAKLLSYVKEYGGELYSVDPFPNFDYKQMEEENPGLFHMCKGLSLDYLSKIDPCDAYLLDGDHNWYTVYHELSLLHQVCKDRDPIIFIHDIGWPYARRDLYYNPENIPQKYQKNYKRGGMLPGQNDLVADGFNNHLCNATTEGDMCNGVLTAVEDFLSAHTNYTFFTLNCLSGLGILYRKGTHPFIEELFSSAKMWKNLSELTERERLTSEIARFKWKYRHEHISSKYEAVTDQYEKQTAGFNELQVMYNAEINKCKALSEDLNRERNMIETFLKYERIFLNEHIRYLENENSNLLMLNRELSAKFEQTLNSSLSNQPDIQALNNKIKLLNRENRKLKENIEILRAEGRSVRSQNRLLTRKLYLIQSSRWYKILEKLHTLLSRRKAPDQPVISAASLPENYQCGEDKYSWKLRKLPSLRWGEDTQINTVTVVVCVHNAYQDVIECLESVWQNRSFPYEITIVDDGSDEKTKVLLEDYQKATGCRLIRNEYSLGYTKSANLGLKSADTDYVVLLNSDTIVTDSWVEKMLQCCSTHTNTGIVSPLSNAASYQSVPEIKDSDTGDWKINQLPKGINVEMMNMIVNKSSQKRYPKVFALNGFCFMISRAVIAAIGYLDEKNFPRGYGEEVDYCIRARKAGFDLRIVDDTYIFHEKSKSFSHETRKELGTASKPVLKSKHGDFYKEIGKFMENMEELDDIRKSVRFGIETYGNILKSLHGKKIAFMLTTKGGNGGANSVCNEVRGMHKLGIDAYILNTSNYEKEFSANYPELISHTLYFNKKSQKEMLKVSEEFDVIIGTIFTTIRKINEIKAVRNDLKVGYYIQDYEPMFFEADTPYYVEAMESYTLIPDNFLFAKTKWLTEIVAQKHKCTVNKVEPSIDTYCYNPFIVKSKNMTGILNIVAMIRPKTERRNPKGTLHVLKMLKDKFGDKINIQIFGCTEEELKDFSEYTDFDHHNFGVLKRWEVVQLLADGHIFLDMSTYQAFGRTGLEGMCMGCVPVLPIEGGAGQYARNNQNALLVDTKDDIAVYDKISYLINNTEYLSELQKEGLQTAKDYSILNAVWSELVVLNSVFMS